MKKYIKKQLLTASFVAVLVLLMIVVNLSRLIEILYGFIITVFIEFLQFNIHTIIFIIFLAFILKGIHLWWRRYKVDHDKMSMQ